MRFWASSESHAPAGHGLERARRLVEPHLTAEFARLSLPVLDCEIQYVPIVMPEDMHSRYPARSKLRKKRKLFGCAPQLDYHVFVEGDLRAQLTEYVTGILESADHLAALGASQEQISQFKNVLKETPDLLLLQHSDQQNARSADTPENQ